MDVFDIFKIIFGIIITFFIIQFLLSFLSSYTQIGETSKQISSLASFNKVLQDVYTTGIPTTFTLYDYDKIDFYEPPNMITKAGTLRIENPTVFVPEKNLLLYRGELDLEWWKFYFIYALPGTNILYVPMNNSPLVWNVMSNLTNILPSTERLDTKIMFGFGCNGSIYYFSTWERERFLNIIGYISTDYENLVDNDCSDVGIPQFYKIIRISTDYSEKPGVLIVPNTSNIGYVYVDGRPYLYKNPIDIVYAIFGGKGIYEYGNKEFFSKLRESQMLALKKGELCATYYNDFISILNQLKPLNNYTNELEMKIFSEKLSDSIEKYKELEVMGCE
jgi:hypothetical protein